MGRTVEELRCHRLIPRMSNITWRFVSEHRTTVVHNFSCTQKLFCCYFRGLNFQYIPVFFKGRNGDLMKSRCYFFFFLLVRNCDIYLCCCCCCQKCLWRSKKYNNIPSICFYIFFFCCSSSQKHWSWQDSTTLDAFQRLQYTLLVPTALKKYYYFNKEV